MMMQKQQYTGLMNKTGEVEVHITDIPEVHITDNQSWNSCHKVASDHDYRLIEPTKKKHNAL